jgi:hypothetical protein
VITTVVVTKAAEKDLKSTNTNTDQLEAENGDKTSKE